MRSISIYLKNKKKHTTVINLIRMHLFISLSINYKKHTFPEMRFLLILIYEDVCMYMSFIILSVNSQDF